MIGKWLGVAVSLPLAAACCLALTIDTSPGTDKLEKQAPEADPLPTGAVTRLGTTRLRYFDRYRARCVAVSPNGDEVVAGCGGYLRRWNTATGKESQSLFWGRDELLAVAYFPDGKRLAVTM